MPLTPRPSPCPTVAVFHGDGNITQYHPGSDGVTVDESSTMRNGPVDISLEFQSFGTSHLRHTVPLRNVLEVLGLPDPYSLDALEAAWENAEQADKCLEGDVLISSLPLDGGGGFKISPSRSRGLLNAAVTRILSRSPREPWSDLADILADMGHLSPTAHAKALHARGVRVTGGDEK